MLICIIQCTKIVRALPLHCYHLWCEAWSDQFWYSVFFLCFLNFCCCCYFVTQNVQWLLVLWLSIVITSGGRLELINFDIQCFLCVFFKLLLLLLFCSTKRSMIVGTLTLHCYHLRWQAGTWKPTNCATNCGRRLN